MNGAIIRTNGNGGGIAGPIRGGQPTQEQRYGQEQFWLRGAGRLQQPEDSNADMALIDPHKWQASSIVQIPGAIALAGRYTVFQYDYNTIANMQYFRGGGSLMDAEGRNDQQNRALTLTGGGTGHFVAETWSGPNTVLGFQLEWGLSVLNYQPFTMTIHADRWYGRSLQPLDRKVELRMDQYGRGGGAGGVIAFLFASRITANQAYGTYSATGGMNKAVVQPAVFPAQDGVVLAPRLNVYVPPAIETYFSATCHLYSVGSPYLAALREALLAGIPDMPQEGDVNGYHPEG